GDDGVLVGRHLPRTTERSLLREWRCPGLLQQHDGLRLYGLSRPFRRERQGGDYTGRAGHGLSEEGRQKLEARERGAYLGGLGFRFVRHGGIQGSFRGRRL